MRFIYGICLFFKKLFIKEEKVKLIEAPVEQSEDKIRSKFVNSLKVKISINKKRKVETLTCIGDGLGLQNKVEY